MNKKTQSMLEYILLLGITVIVIFSLFSFVGKVRENVFERAYQENRNILWKN